MRRQYPESTANPDDAPGTRSRSKPGDTERGRPVPASGIGRVRRLQRESLGRGGVPAPEVRCQGGDQDAVQGSPRNPELAPEHRGQAQVAAGVARGGGKLRSVYDQEIVESDRRAKGHGHGGGENTIAFDPSGEAHSQADLWNQANEGGRQSAATQVPTSLSPLRFLIT